MVSRVCCQFPICELLAGRGNLLAGGLSIAPSRNHSANSSVEGQHSLAKARQEIRFPNFLYIGASRSGSTWLYQILKEHPDVFVPLAKDVMFFDRNFERGLGWYASYFKNWGQETAAGELSHCYFLEETTAVRIHQTLPDVKLICCLREPVDKALSDYLYNQNVTMEVDLRLHKDFADYVRLPEVAWAVNYDVLLAPFFKLFGPQRILVLFYDELKSNPEDFAKRVYTFLGVDAGVRPPSLHTRINAARTSRFSGASWVAKKLGEWIRARGMGNVVGLVKHSPLFVNLFYSQGAQKPRLDDKILSEARLRLPRRFAELEQLVGRRVPDAWYNH